MVLVFGMSLVRYWVPSCRVTTVGAEQPASTSRGRYRQWQSRSLEVHDELSIVEKTCACRERLHLYISGAIQAYAKMEALEQAAYEVEVYENHIDILLSMHKECAESVKWKRLLSNPEPGQPLKSGTLEKEATYAAATYLPSFRARLFKPDARQRVAPVGKIGAAQAEDERQFQAQFDEWKTAHIEYIGQFDTQSNAH